MSCSAWSGLLSRGPLIDPTTPLCDNVADRRLTRHASSVVEAWSARVSGAWDPGSVKLLLVEDDRAIAAVVARGLEAEGFTVEMSPRRRRGSVAGHRGCLRPHRSRPHAARAKRIPGLQRAARAGNWTPILMLTAKDGDLDEAEALDTGADDYLVKPFSFPVLVSRVRALLRRTAGRTPAPVEVGDLRIDPGARRVWRGDTEIALTARQFDVLEFLVRRAGQVLTKDEILAGVWPYDFDGDPNIVEVYVRRLRQRVDEPFDRHDIQTVRGAGYRLGASAG